MRILVCGGRDYDDHETVFKALSAVRDWVYHDDTIIHGAAPGADTLAGEFAAYYKIPVESYPADWAGRGKAAGPIRNQQMLDTGIDLVVAFPGGRGTEDMKRRAKAAGVLVLAVEHD